MWIMQKVFGLDEEYLICKPDEAEGKFIMKQVMQGGNFGHYDERKVRFSNYRLQSLAWSVQNNWHLVTHYPDKVFWAPVWLAWHYVWKRTVGRI